MLRNSRVIYERPNIIPIITELNTSMKEELSPKARGEYSLKENFFDPTKSSPPNDFIIKLNSRIHRYSSFQTFYESINVDKRDKT
jgi:hypothetical protein